MRKQYGQSQSNICPFCGKNAVTQNAQHVAVCSAHKGAYLDLKCVCGSWLEIKSGKWGPFGNCMQCGNMTLKKALEINPPPKAEAKTETSVVKRTTKPTSQNHPQKTITKKPTRVEITSDDIDLFYS